MSLINPDFQQYMQDHYWKENQVINLETHDDIKASRKTNNFHSLEIFYKDRYFLDIQTLRYVPSDELGTIPYCLRVEWGWLITVQKFEQLTDDDIAKAIGYVLRDVLDSWHIWNVKFNGKYIDSRNWKIYTKDNHTIREYKENLNRIKKNDK